MESSEATVTSDLLNARQFMVGGTLCDLFGAERALTAEKHDERLLRVFRHAGAPAPEEARLP